MPHHKDLTGTDLHEPKGIASAASNTVYVADGAGSGAWTPLDQRTPPGMIADFTTPAAPSGWLELNGQVVNISAEPDLYAAQTLQQSGTRTNGSPIVTGLSSTSNMRAGFYVVGTGIASGTTILTVDSSTQITLSANASSSGTATVVVSPWLVSATQMTLPDVTTAGRYRRSRTSSTAVGQVQADQNKAHTHSLSSAGQAASAGAHTHTTDSQGAHTHTGTTNSGGVDHNHLQGYKNTGSGSFTGPGGDGWGGDASANTGQASAYLHTHTFTTGSSGAHTHTALSSGDHTHDLSGNTDSQGGTEARPLTLVVITCVKT